MSDKVKTDASWIRATLRRKSLREFKQAKKKYGAGAEEPAKDADFTTLKESGMGKQPAKSTGGRPSLAQRRATLKQKQRQMSSHRRASKEKLEKIRSRASFKGTMRGRTPSKRVSEVIKEVEMDVIAGEPLKERLLKKRNSSIKPAATRVEEIKLHQVEKKPPRKRFPQAEVETKAIESGFEESESEYEYTGSEEYTEEEEEEEEENEELNEMNFNKLLQIRVQTTDFQLDSFCAKYVFILKKQGVKQLHTLADEFETLCSDIYEPMLRKKAPLKRKGTLRKKDLEEDKKIAEKKISIPKEVPVEHELTNEFLQANFIRFENELERTELLNGLHIMENISFFQFLLMKFRDLILDQHCERWDKKKEELEHKSHGSIILEEFFMPPMKIEPKLDTELVKFSKLMSNREFEINKFKKKMMRKEPNSVAFNVLKNELFKYIKELEEKIKMSEIYFAAAIMKVNQKQQRELDRVYEEIEAEDEEAQAVEVDSESESVDV